jgi:Spy/CpxP family protein refolding chaperone
LVRAIKALSKEDTASLLKGEGMGMAKAAELNGYPGPAHVLAFARELRLSDEQRQQVQAIFDQMHTRAVALGTEIVEREQAMDQQFAKGEVTTGDVAAETAKIAALQGQLRSVHLEAHLETKPLLNPHQLMVYQKLRGYGAPAAPTHHQHG